MIVNFTAFFSHNMPFRIEIIEIANKIRKTVQFSMTDVFSGFFIISS